MLHICASRSGLLGTQGTVTSKLQHLSGLRQDTRNLQNAAAIMPAALFPVQWTGMSTGMFIFCRLSIVPVICFFPCPAKMHTCKYTVNRYIRQGFLCPQNAVDHTSVAAAHEQAQSFFCAHGQYLFIFHLICPPAKPSVFFVPDPEAGRPLFKIRAVRDLPDQPEAWGNLFQVFWYSGHGPSSQRGCPECR